MSKKKKSTPIKEKVVKAKESNKSLVVNPDGDLKVIENIAEKAPKKAPKKEVVKEKPLVVKQGTTYSRFIM